MVEVGKKKSSAKPTQVTKNPTEKHNTTSKVEKNKNSDKLSKVPAVKPKGKVAETVKKEVKKVQTGKNPAPQAVKVIADKAKASAKPSKAEKTQTKPSTLKVTQAKKSEETKKVVSESEPKKISQKVEKKPSVLEMAVTEAFRELRSNPKLAMAMKRKLPLVKVLEVDSHGSKSIVIYIKAYILNALKRVLPTLKPELEKKMGKQVFFIGYRRIIQKPAKRTAESKIHRPHRRTVTGVHENILNDLIYPSEIMGKRTVYRPNGVKMTKIFLDEKFRVELEGRLKSFTDVYKRLAGRDYKFEFPLYNDPMRFMLAAS